MDKTMMIRLQLVSVAIVFAVAGFMALRAQSAWTEGTVIGLSTDSSKHPAIVYVWGMGDNGAVNLPQRPLPPDEWHTIDLAELSNYPPPNNLPLPSDVKAIQLAAMVGSSGLIGAECGQVATFRAPGSTLDPWSYQLQAANSTLYPFGAGPYRQQMSVMVPLVDGKFEFWWHASNPECPMFLVLALQFYVR